MLVALSVVNNNATFIKLQDKSSGHRVHSSDAKTENNEDFSGLTAPAS